MDRADTMFSRFIRNRDKRCMNPLCPNGFRNNAPINQLECSHYYDRGILISRFDPDNCFSLCHWCHVAWEDTKQGRYTEIMKRWLGITKFKALQKRVEDYKYKSIPHLSKDDAIRDCRVFLENQ